jgi:hypothetical protein
MLFSFLAVAFLSSAACAAESAAADFSDIDVVAAVPRSASDKPFVMVAFPKKPSEQKAAGPHRKSGYAAVSKSAQWW